jgi:hypothetical protein
MAAGSTYSQIATQTLGSATASVTFSNIPQTYTNLVLVYNGKFAAINGQIALQFNGDTATNYSDTELGGNGSTAFSVRNTSQARMLLGYSASANVDNMVVINIISYQNTATYKTALARNAGAGGNVTANVGLWRSTAAITSMLVFCYNGINFVAGSTFTLYGIKGA